MFHQIFPQETGFLLKINNNNNIPQLKNFRGQCPRVHAFFHVCPLTATLNPIPSGVGDQNLIRGQKLFQAEHFKT